MFLPVLPLLLLLSARSSVSSPLTFHHQDPITGRSLQCDRCPPGTFLRAHCASDKSSQCAPCPEGSYTKLWNYIGQCLRCGVCGRNEVVKKECSADSDCQCECKQGYYYNQLYGMCFPHSACPTGHGVLTAGTPEKDTVCQVCSRSTFSDVLSVGDSCRQHRSCSDAGLQLVLNGSTWHDSVCANCDELKDKADCLKEIIPAFFAHHKMNIKRLRRIVHKLPSENNKNKRETLELNFSELHLRISSWVSSASASQIQQLPDVMMKVGANSFAEKLQKKLNQTNIYLSENCNQGNMVEVDLTSAQG